MSTRFLIPSALLAASPCVQDQLAADRHTIDSGSGVHLELGIEAMLEIGSKGEQIRHRAYWR